MRMQFSRRELIVAMAAAGFLPSSAQAVVLGDAAARAHDWDWLVGAWDVWHRRLKERLANNHDWQEFGGRSVLWLALDGLATIDDNILDMPSGGYRGLTVRAWDPKTDRWAIWWLDGRNPTVIDPPVRGGFAGQSGIFLGPDVFRGTPVTVRFRWLDIYSARPHWEQAMSTDGGKRWEVNWENFFTRTAPAAAPLPLLTGHPRDFDFLHGSWSVRHRRLRQRLAGSDQWEHFTGKLINRPVLGGHANISDNRFERSGGPQTGIGLRSFDSGRGEWLSWWLDGREPTGFGPPLRGRFADGVGSFEGDDLLGTRPVRTRARWSAITPDSARWEQAMSGDNGASWETNWVSEFVRR